MTKIYEKKNYPVNPRNYRKWANWNEFLKNQKGIIIDIYV